MAIFPHKQGSLSLVNASLVGLSARVVSLESAKEKEAEVSEEPEEFFSV